MSENEKPPPSSPVDEKGALSCILQEGERSPGGGVELLGQLVAANFRDRRNLSIFSTLENLRDKGNQLDTPNLVNCLNGDVEISYVTSLVDEAPSPLQFPVYLKVLKDMTIRRNLRVICQKGLKLSSDKNQSMEGILTELQGEVQNAAQGSRLNSSLPPIEEVGEFLARDIDVPPELIEGLLHQGSKMLISSGSKSYKTFLLLDLALSVASGMPFLGLPTKKSKVLYVNLELQEPFAQKRLKAILRAKGLADVSGMEILNLRGHACDIEKLSQQVLSHISEGEFGLVVIDPIYKLYGDRDENSVSHVTSLMNLLECICRVGNVALVFAAHQTKGNQAGKESIDRISGSGAFARDVDCGLILTAHDEAKCYTAEASILRNLPPLSPFVVRWDYPLMGRDEALDPKHLKARKNPNSSKPCSIEQLMAHVPTDKPIDKNLLRENVNKADIALNKINPLIDRAIEEGKLFVHLIKRPGTNALRRIARYPQEQQQDLHDSHDPHS
jgi:hypothetical protein